MNLKGFGSLAPNISADHLGNQWSFRGIEDMNQKSCHNCNKKKNVEHFHDFLPKKNLSPSSSPSSYPPKKKKQQLPFYKKNTHLFPFHLSPNSVFLWVRPPDIWHPAKQHISQPLSLREMSCWGDTTTTRDVCLEDSING